MVNSGLSPLTRRHGVSSNVGSGSREENAKKLDMFQHRGFILRDARKRAPLDEVFDLHGELATGFADPLRTKGMI